MVTLFKKTTLTVNKIENNFETFLSKGKWLPSTSKLCRNHIVLILYNVAMFLIFNKINEFLSN